MMSTACIPDRRRKIRVVFFVILSAVCCRPAILEQPDDFPGNLRNGYGHNGDTGGW